MENAFYFAKSAHFIIFIFKFLESFSFLSNIFKFKEEVENEVITTSWNGLLNLSFLVFSNNSKNLIELKHQNWRVDGSLKKENL